MIISEETPEQIIAKHISAMNDSVSTISELMQEIPTDEVKNRVIANYKHLEIMLEKSELNLNNQQKTVFLNSINQAKGFVGL